MRLKFRFCIRRPITQLCGSVCDPSKRYSIFQETNQNSFFSSRFRLGTPDKLHLPILLIYGLSPDRLYRSSFFSSSNLVFPLTWMFDLGLRLCLGNSSSLPRKEVIQPHLPIRLPCYDFTPVISLTFDGCALAVHSPASGAPNSHGVTGGVYKARERIHRGMLIRDY